ncbi:hypothetical protein ACJMK2_021751, partial [Sinanodonta woodiana]
MPGESSTWQGNQSKSKGINQKTRESIKKQGNQLNGKQINQMTRESIKKQEKQSNDKGMIKEQGNHSKSK